jgi:hypothetical protein
MLMKKVLSSRELTEMFLQPIAAVELKDEHFCSSAKRNYDKRRNNPMNTESKDSYCVLSVAFPKL